MRLSYIGEYDCFELLTYLGNSHVAGISKWALNELCPFPENKLSC